MLVFQLVNWIIPINKYQNYLNNIFIFYIIHSIIYMLYSYKLLNNSNNTIVEFILLSI
jgi:hypothetical protein